jgi:hypothetical protein
MKKTLHLTFLLLVTTVLFAIPASAADRTADAPLRPRSIVARSLTFARTGPGTVSANAAAGCFDVDASGMCLRGDEGVGENTGGASSEKCPTATNFETCMSKCGCEYRNAYNKCSTVRCRQMALTERNACEGMCIADYDPA